MTCPDSNTTLDGITPGCGGDLVLNQRFYLCPPAGGYEYPVLSSRPILPSELVWRKLGKPHEVTLANVDPDDLQKLRAGFPGGVTVDGAGVVTIKAYIVL